MTMNSMDHGGVYFHRPGTLSPRGILDVGLKCVHSCRFCYYSFWDKSDDQFRALRQAKFRTGTDCREILSGLAAQGLEFYDITGGEPALHPELVDIVRHGSALGLKGRLITLGQFLSGPDGLLDRLLEAGLTDFLFSVHSVEEESFRQFTGGSWERLKLVMDTLDAKGFSYGANTVIFDGNVERLEAIARESVRHRVYVHNFIVFNAYHEWNSTHRVAGVQARFSDIAQRLGKAVAILEDAGLAVNIRYVPLCAFPGLERNVVGVLGLPYDPFEWRNRACNYERDPAYCSELLPIPDSGVREQFAFAPLAETSPGGVDLIGMRGDHFKLFPSVCRDCAALPACDGVDPKYLERNGTGELRPFGQASLTGPLLSARLGYGPAHRVKASQYADPGLPAPCEKA